MVALDHARPALSPGSLCALFGLGMTLACGAGGGEENSARRLPSQNEGQAMVRLPAAGSVKSQEAALGVRKPRAKKARKERVTAKPTDRGLRSDTGEPVDAGAAKDAAEAEAERAKIEDAARAEREAAERAAEAEAKAKREALEREAEEETERSGKENAQIGVRDPPSGTPPKIAQVFRRLPVSVHDGPPLEGIGATGIHIDRIWLGSKNTRRGCGGKDDNFSISGRDEVNVCFRVVHGRIEEDVDVIWEKDGDLAQRRRGVTIPAAHAYRSRSYLALRNEYVGAWRVRIFSVDGVELATKTFKVVD